MKNKNLRYLTQGALIAAMYVLLTYVSDWFGLAGDNVIQFRLSEMLCIFACFTPAAIPGLYIGCLLANLLMGAIFWDVIFGSLATLIGAIGTWLLRKNPYLAVIPPILSNVVIVSLVLKYAYQFGDAIWFLMLTVGIGEIVMCGILGVAMFYVIRRYRKPLGLSK